MNRPELSDPYVNGGLGLEFRFLEEQRPPSSVSEGEIRAAVEEEEEKNKSNLLEISFDNDSHELDPKLLHCPDADDAAAGNRE